MLLSGGSAAIPDDCQHLSCSGNRGVGGTNPGQPTTVAEREIPRGLEGLEILIRLKEGAHGDGIEDP